MVVVGFESLGNKLTSFSFEMVVAEVVVGEISLSSVLVQVCCCGCQNSIITKCNKNFLPLEEA